MKATFYLRRILLPFAVFMTVVLVHLSWKLAFYEGQDIQQKFAAVAEQTTALDVYLETGSYWLGYSYGVSLAFAAWALRRYREGRSCQAGRVAIGGFTLSGFLAVAGCYLAGCCGSPMLAVYLGLFGAAWLPFAKPLVAGITTVFIAAAWLWTQRRPENSCGDQEKKSSRRPTVIEAP